MFDPRSDYALNKLNPDAIVCKSVTGVHIRITREDFASEEEFQRWKTWYDNDLHEEEKRNHICDDNDLSLEGLAEAAVVSPSAEAVIEHRARNRAKKQYNAEMFINTRAQLTKTQYRRIWLYFVDGMTEQQIAMIEGVGQQRISKSIVSSVNKIKTFLESGNKRG